MLGEVRATGLHRRDKFNHARANAGLSVSLRDNLISVQAYCQRGDRRQLSFAIER